MFKTNTLIGINPILSRKNSDKFNPLIHKKFSTP